MSEEITALLAEIESLVDDDDFECEADRRMAKIAALGAGMELTPHLLAMMERHPLSDFGCPGPLVHFMEQAYGMGEAAKAEHDRQVAGSVRRRPALHTLWMLNRIINVSQGEKQEESLSLLARVAEDMTWEQPVRDQAKEYLDYQRR